MPGQQLVGITPREQVLIRGGVSLLVWAAIGALLFAAVELVPARHLRRMTTRRGLAVVGITVALLLLTLHMFWPLLAAIAVLTCVVLAIAVPQHRLARAVACAIAVAGVAVSYEASRLRYGIEWSVVTLERPSGEARGLLIGQTDRGVYIGEPSRPGARLTSLFVPARRVSLVATSPLARTVNPTTLRARREPIRDRVWRFLTR